MSNLLPGPVTAGSCPPPTEIVVIEAPKVYDFCFQEDRLERAFTLDNLADGAMVLACEIKEVHCCEVADRRPLNDGSGLFEVTLRIDICIRVILRPGLDEEPVKLERLIRFQKRVLLCAPEGTDVTCDVNGNCLCTLQPSDAPDPNLFCTINLCVTVTVCALVKLLVPTFGLVLPKACQEAAFAGCPPVPPPGCGPVRLPNDC